MSEERLLILKMIAEGKLTPEEGDKLLDAVGRGAGPGSGEAPPEPERVHWGRHEDGRSGGPPPPPPPPPHIPDMPDMERMVAGAVRQAKVAIGPALREGLKGLQGLRSLKGIKTFVHSEFKGRSEGKDYEGRLGLQPGDEVRVNTVSGDVSVRSVDGETMVVVAHCRVPAESPDWQLSLERTGSTVEVKMNCGSDPSGLVGETDYEILVPSWARVSCGSISGDVDIRGVKAGFRVQSVSGDVSARDCAGGFEARSTSGDVRVDNTGSASGELESVSGDISGSISDLTPGSQLRAKTVSGDVNLKLPRDAGFRLTCKTFSGDVNAFGQSIVSDHTGGDGTTGKLTHIQNSPVSEVVAESMSGDVTVGLWGSDDTR